MNLKFLKVCNEVMKKKIICIYLFCKKNCKL